MNELNESNQYDILADYVTPHWRVSYEEELKIKHSFCQNVLATIANKFLPNTRLEIDVEKIISSVSVGLNTKYLLSFWLHFNLV